jgi:four helix bundle protein
LSKQILQSGTAIGALISEARFGQSKAKKEASETDYWLCLLKDGKYMDEKLYKSLAADVNELISMLVATVKTSKNKS